VNDMMEFYKNYLHPIILDAGPREAFKNMCKVYKKEKHTIYRVSWTYDLHSF
jgi:hypothetical protein